MRKAMYFLVVLKWVGSLWAAEPTTGMFKLNIAKSKIPPNNAANLEETIAFFLEIDADPASDLTALTSTLFTAPLEALKISVRQRVPPGSGSQNDVRRPDLMDFII